MRIFLIVFIILFSTIEVFGSIEEYSKIIDESVVRDNVKEARIDIENKFNKEPEDIGLIYCLGVLYSTESATYDDKSLIDKRNELYDKGIELANKKLKEEGDNYETYYYLASFYGSDNESLKSIYKSINLNKKSIYPYLFLANYYTDKKMYKLAERLYEKVLKLNNKIAVAYYKLGNIYEVKNKIKEAKDYWEKAFNADPSYTVAYINLFVYSIDNNKPEQFLTILLRGIEKIPYSPKLYIDLGLTYESMANVYGLAKYYSLTIHAFKKAIMLTNNNQTKQFAYRRLFNNYMDIEKWAKAINAFDNARASGYKESAIEKLALAECYLELNELKKSEDILIELKDNKDAINKCPQRLYTVLIEFYIKNNEIEVALNTAKKALNTLPESMLSSIWYCFGDIYYQKKEYMNAINAYEKGLSLLNKHIKEYELHKDSEAGLLRNNTLCCYKRIKKCYKSLMDFEKEKEYDTKIAKIYSKKF